MKSERSKRSNLPGRLAAGGLIATFLLLVARPHFLRRATPNDEILLFAATTLFFSGIAALEWLRRRLGAAGARAFAFFLVGVPALLALIFVFLIWFALDRSNFRF